MRLYQASASAVSLTAYVIPVYAQSFHSLIDLTSSTTATLGMSGWLDLAQLGLAPNQKHQAFLGAPTLVQCREPRLDEGRWTSAPAGLFLCQVALIARRTTVDYTSGLRV